MDAWNVFREILSVTPSYSDGHFTPQVDEFVHDCTLYSMYKNIQTDPNYSIQ
jgi:hypothetical protein